MAALPLQKGESAEEPGTRLQKSLAAVIRGCIPNCSPEDFPADPETGCKNMATFLNVWFPVTNNKVSIERNAFAEACNRLKAAEVKQIVANIHAYRSWLKMKKKNMKTGGRTDPMIRMLMNTVTGCHEQNDSQESSQAKPAMANEKHMDETKPGKAQGVKASVTKPEEVVDMIPSPKPAKAAEESQSSKPVMADGQNIDSPEPAKAVVLDFETPRSKMSPGIASVVSVSSADVMPASSMCPSEKKPAQAASKRPAAQVKSLKRPAAAEEKSKPAKATAKAKTKAEPAKAMAQEKKGQKRSWVTSQSFGYIHETRAKGKAYIRAKPEMADKPVCLVNVNVPAGEKQKEIMDVLFQKAQEPGWTKEALVSKKDDMVSTIQIFV